MRQKVGALLTFGDGLTFYHRHRIFHLAAEGNHVAEQVDQILRGTKPGDIAVARPQQFRLVIDHDVARSLGLKIPSALLLRDRRLE